MPSPAPGLRSFAHAALVGTSLLLAGCGGRDSIPLSSVAPPQVRVRLGEPKESATLSIADAWEAFATDGRAWADRGSNTTADLSASAGGIVLRGKPTGVEAIRIRPRGAFTLNTGSGARAYRGELLVRMDQGRL